MYELPTFYHFENFDDVLGISLRCQLQRVSDYLLSKDDTMASFILPLKTMIFMRRTGCDATDKNSYYFRRY